MIVINRNAVLSVAAALSLVLICFSLFPSDKLLYTGLDAHRDDKAATTQHLDDHPNSHPDALPSLDDLPRPRPVVAHPFALSGPLAKSVYTLFEQVYGVQDPPILKLDTIQHACSNSTHKSNLYLECELLMGGLTTLQSQIKTCLNLAFWYGLNIVIPTTPLRASDDPSGWNLDAHLPLGHWVDRDFLIERVQNACPETKFALLNEKKEPSIEVAETQEWIDSGNEISFGSFVGPFAANEDDRPWREFFERKIEKIAESRNGMSPDAGATIVKLRSSAMMFNATSTPEMQNLFFEMSHLLRVTPQVRDIVARIIAHLATNTDGELKTFYGVHFRAEKDVIGPPPSPWRTPEEQLDRTFDVAEEARLLFDQGEEDRMMYLACGDHNMTELFRATAHSRNWHVVDKWSIASEIGEDLVMQIEALDFDHEALIDFAMLLISDFFIGTGVSAFSYSIAHDRHPAGRFAGNVLDVESNDATADVAIRQARTHLFEHSDGGGAYQCCL